MNKQTLLQPGALAPEFWSYLSPVGINSGTDGILKALGEMAPHNVEMEK